MEEITKMAQNHMKENKKGQNWRMGYQTGYEEASKAFGGCTDCYGKGYATTIDYTVGHPDFSDDPEYMKQNPIMRFCDCDRGKQLKKHYNDIQGKMHGMQ